MVPRAISAVLIFGILTLSLATEEMPSAGEVERFHTEAELNVKVPESDSEDFRRFYDKLEPVADEVKSTKKSVDPVAAPAVIETTTAKTAGLLSINAEGFEQFKTTRVKQVAAAPLHKHNAAEGLVKAGYSAEAAAKLMGVKVSQKLIKLAKLSAPKNSVSKSAKKSMKAQSIRNLIKAGYTQKQAAGLVHRKQDLARLKKVGFNREEAEGLMGASATQNSQHVVHLLPPSKKVVQLMAAGYSRDAAEGLEEEGKHAKKKAARRNIEELNAKLDAFNHAEGMARSGLTHSQMTEIDSKFKAINHPNQAQKVDAVDLTGTKIVQKTIHKKESTLQRKMHDLEAAGYSRKQAEDLSGMRSQASGLVHAGYSTKEAAGLMGISLTKTKELLKRPANSIEESIVRPSKKVAQLMTAGYTKEQATALASESTANEVEKKKRDAIAEKKQRLINQGWSQNEADLAVSKAPALTNDQLKAYSQWQDNKNGDNSGSN